MFYFFAHQRELHPKGALQKIPVILIEGEFLDLFQRKSQKLQRQYPLQPGKLLLPIIPVTLLTDLFWPDQALFLIVMNRPHGYVGPLSKLTRGK